MTATTPDLHWLAAFLEGEGHFRWTRTACYISAAQVQRWPLDKCARFMGGSFRRHLRQHENPKWSDAWRWQLGGGAAAGWMMTLYVLMSPRRREQIAAALAEWRSRKPTKVRRRECPYGHPYTADNTLSNVGADGYRHRHCRTCARLRSSAPARVARRAFEAVA